MISLPSLVTSTPLFRNTPSRQKILAELKKENPELNPTEVNLDPYLMPTPTLPAHYSNTVC